MFSSGINVSVKKVLNKLVLFLKEGLSIFLRGKK